jgi:uncharacterized protein HemX
VADPDVAALAARAIGIAQEATRTQSAIVAQQGKSRRNLRWLAVSVVLDVALSVALGALAFGQAHTSEAIHNSQVSACQQANVKRAQDVAVWNRLLRLPPTATSAQKTEIAELEKLVGVKDAPRDCAALYRK